MKQNNKINPIYQPIRRFLLMKKILLLLAILTCSACSQIEKRGYSFDLSDFSSLKEGINNKNDALNAMGYPSFSNDYGNQEVWFYYSEDIKKFLFFKPEVINRKIIAISFDQNQIIDGIKNYNLQNQNNFTIDSSYTKTQQTKSSWWKQIFNNIGQIRPN